MTNSFSLSNFVSIFLFTSSISFFISNTSCEVNHDNTLSSSVKSPAHIINNVGFFFLIYLCIFVLKHFELLPSNTSGTLFLKYTKDGRLMMLYLDATSGSDILTMSIPNKSASPSIISSSSRMSPHSSQFSSSVDTV